jgi:hypothetical protein
VTGISARAVHVRSSARVRFLSGDRARDDDDLLCDAHAVM